MGKNKNIGTYTLTTTGGPTGNGVYTISLADGVSRAAFLLSVGGAATVQGNATIAAFGGASGSIALDAGVSFMISTNNENEFIDVVVITVTSGTVKVVCNQ